MEPGTGISTNASFESVTKVSASTKIRGSGNDATVTLDETEDGVSVTTNSYIDVETTGENFSGVAMAAYFGILSKGSSVITEVNTVANDIQESEVWAENIGFVSAVNADLHATTNINGSFAIGSNNIDAFGEAIFGVADCATIWSPNTTSVRIGDSEPFNPQDYSETNGTYFPDCSGLLTPEI